MIKNVNYIPLNGLLKGRNYENYIITFIGLLINVILLML